MGGEDTIEIAFEDQSASRTQAVQKVNDGRLRGRGGESTKLRATEHMTASGEEGASPTTLPTLPPKQVSARASICLNTQTLLVTPRNMCAKLTLASEDINHPA